MMIEEVATEHTPESLAALALGRRGLALLLSARHDLPHGRFSFLAADPFLQFSSNGSRCVTTAQNGFSSVQYGNPWHLLDAWVARFELSREPDMPLPLGGCFGFWGYDLKKFTEPKLRCRLPSSSGLPDCHVGFYDSLVAFDHHLGKCLVISTGLNANGSRSPERARTQARGWKELLTSDPLSPGTPAQSAACTSVTESAAARSNLSRDGYITRVQSAQHLIRQGEIYQVNVARRLSASWQHSPWRLFRRLTDSSPAPVAAFYDAGQFQIISSSPEVFLKLSGHQIITRPIKGTRPRSLDTARDAQFAFELQTSPKETSELVMITDLLRNDLGRVCKFGSVSVPELLALERYAQVQHLVSTVKGDLRSNVNHLQALASCFPGGSITGAPKFRAMEIIDELEPTPRGPYTGALGYLGFNGESQLSILIRSIVLRHHRAHFHTGAGIVADSDPQAEYDETTAKAQGFLHAIAAHGLAERNEKRMLREAHDIG
jgi:para-aminobenzoate synthetase component 1